MDGSTSLAGGSRTADFSYRLDDRYERNEGSVFLTGPQALVRLALMQRRLDRRNGFDTAGFISGYRGSPLGGYDLALWRAAAFLERDDITFQPAINEDLAATAIMGTQQVETDPARTVDGVFAIWYGKGPGVDRSGDALKHGNAYGSSPHGGVLVVAGDDHGCVSSSMSHQSDLAMASWYMPVVHPADLADYLDYGLWGFAASRFSGNWVGFKAISETVESARNVTLKPFPAFEAPAGYKPPAGGLHYRWPDFPGMQIEHRAQAKLDALRAFARANPIDRLALGRPGARLGIVTVGKAHLDLMEALAALGVNRRKAAKLGIAVYKVGLAWPIEDAGLRSFAEGKEELLVVEEKRPVVESQLKNLLYGSRGKNPRIVGKTDEKGRPLVPAVDELRPSVLARIVERRAKGLEMKLPSGPAAGRGRADAIDVDLGTATKRMPYFCSGCPHNTSTKVPDGSMAFGGIGCHFMASWMDRNTTTVIQMGGEGVHWIGRAPYTGDGHAFQNLGDGTYFHSGLMAIRQAVAAGVNLTYKILYNDAVAMTGGQPIDGTLTVPEIARQVREEGVARIAVVSDDPWKYERRDPFPKGTTIHHRDRLDDVQRELRDAPGVSALIYDQTCAAEKRRRRKRGQFPDPPKRVFINEAVCEGCGDCSVQSNCLSIVPVETEFGRKRKIDQSSCNKDYSCLNGFCPSFVTVEGKGVALAEPAAEMPADRFADRIEALPVPETVIGGDVANLLVTGVGGTGIVTVGQILTMAGHLEGKGVSVLDFTGFAQKGGAVLSHIRIAPSPEILNQVRIDAGSADVLLACDIVVATQPEPLAAINKANIRVVVNRTAIPTADYVRDIKADLNYRGRLAALEQAAGKGGVCEVAASEIAAKLMGDTVHSNLFLAGFAWQQGLVPIGLDAVLRAIELNGVAVEANRQAFQLGRLAAGDSAFVDELAAPAREPKPGSLDDLLARHQATLTAYQNPVYAADYRGFVAKVRRAEQGLKPGRQALTEAVAKSLFKLMAYKDEYEVARLYTDGAFADSLGAAFTGRFRLKLHMAPPLLAWRKDARGRPRKLTLGGWWLMPALKALAKLRRLRGTPLDFFGYTAERRAERRLIGDYRATIETLLAGLTRDNYPLAVEIARLPEDIRGFGPVKTDNLEKVKAAEADLLDRYRSPATPQMAAE